MIVIRLRSLPPDSLAPLVSGSEAEGFRFVRRLADEWAAGTNRFDRPGEALFVAATSGRLIGVCGLNTDPFARDPAVGRVRRLYVLPAFRRHGVGRRLIEAVTAAARGRFRSLRLRTDDAGAARFYEAVGFRPWAGSDATHILHMTDPSPVPTSSPP